MKHVAAPVMDHALHLALVRANSDMTERIARSASVVSTARRVKTLHGLASCATTMAGVLQELESVNACQIGRVRPVASAPRASSARNVTHSAMTKLRAKVVASAVRMVRVVASRHRRNLSNVPKRMARMSVLPSCSHNQGNTTSTYRRKIAL